MYILNHPKLADARCLVAWVFLSGSPVINWKAVARLSHQRQFIIRLLKDENVMGYMTLCGHMVFSTPTNVIALNQIAPKSTGFFSAITP